MLHPLTQAVARLGQIVMCRRQVGAELEDPMIGRDRLRHLSRVAQRIGKIAHRGYKRGPQRKCLPVAAHCLLGLA